MRLLDFHGRPVGRTAIALSHARAKLTASRGESFAIVQFSRIVPKVNHGRGISTRYGHLSKILVAANARVTRGQLIALMGSTGRSTGSHLHYEVRVDGQAVNPIPFLQTADYLSPAREIKPVQVVPGASDIAN
jgi:hypothetical protein